MDHWHDIVRGVLRGDGGRVTEASISQRHHNMGIRN
jgi:hypothetical protein